ncbi:MAG: DUF342 domain-containing protein [Epsilonproteobacteria bacterium]|nr:DUF342 domain-containing protein [Campylobacterota bacterium]
MGLFEKVFKKEDAKEQKNTKNKTFKHVVLRTHDIPQALKEISANFNMPITSLDFRLIDTRTFIKMDEKEEWTEVEAGDWEQFNTTEILLNPNFQVKQDYEVEIKKYKEEPWEKDLILQIAANREKTRIVATIKKGSILLPDERLTEKIRDAIHKKMVKAGMLIGLWDLDFGETLDALVAKAVVEGSLKIEEDVAFDVAKCHAAVPAVDDKLLLLYKQKQEPNEKNGRIDFSRRGFIHAVEAGEILIEYIKPRPGRPGRNCQGVYVPVEEPKETQKPDFSVSENITVEETEEKILYRAAKGGYVVFEDGKYDIRDEMEVEEVSFKTTGSIDAGVETDVKIHVQEKDSLKDAIGTGVEIEATDIKVEGNVGASAVVQAESVEIGGQTHQSSKIFADRARVNVLRGFLKVKETAKIGRIEGGSVIAKRAEVGQMIGGEIRAMEVSVKVIGSNAKIYAVSSIDLDDMRGENNKLVIDAAEIEAYHDEIKSLEERIASLEEELEKLNEKLNEKMELFQKSESAVRTLKQRIVEDKRRGIPPKPAFMAKIRQFQKLAEKIADLKAEKAELVSGIEESKTLLAGYQDMMVSAVVRNKGAWKEYTLVEYHLLTPAVTLEYRPVPGAEGEEIYLEKVDDEGYVVAVRKING